ncbi:MAG: class I SAM-dependent methyltransferase [Bacteroidota bacterium]|nr:class I SAM-dependent methyltransferase [Bacteroidota bacterium]
MQPTAFVFDDTIAQNYDDYLGPFTFEPFAADLAGRATATPAAHALELACGTGRVTRHLAAHLAPPAQLTATDLNAGMLAVAQRNIRAPDVAWDLVDMTHIPYADETFDLVVCQFGVMFAPDKPQALREMHRVLVPGGRLLFNTWADVADNQLFALANAVATAYFGSNPGSPAQGPFSMQDEAATRQLLAQAGFGPVTVHSVQKSVSVESAGRAATGFIMGTPMLTAIQQRDPALLPEMQQKLAAEFRRHLGDYPLRSSLRAWVFEAGKGLAILG